jgi:hypothetical protein
LEFRSPNFNNFKLINHRNSEGAIALGCQDDEVMSERLRPAPADIPLETIAQAIGLTIAQFQQLQS